jgi:hypothetical protein
VPTRTKDKCCWNDEMAKRFTLRTLFLAATLTCVLAALTAAFGWDAVFVSLVFASPCLPALRWGWDGIVSAALIIYIAIAIETLASAVLFQDGSEIAGFVMWLGLGLPLSLFFALPAMGLTLGIRALQGKLEMSGGGPARVERPAP